MAIQVVSVLILILMLIFFLMTRVASPVFDAEGEVQARLNSQSVASSINSLATLESGIIVKKLDGIWDIELYKKTGFVCTYIPFTDDCGWYIKFTHNDFEGEARIIGNLPLEEINFTEKSSITIEKGEKIEIS